MAATTSVSDNIGRLCPDWCNQHLGDLHQRTLAGLGTSLQIALEQQDWNGSPGVPQISFRFCADGDLIDDSIEMSLDAVFTALAGRTTK